MSTAQLSIPHSNTFLLPLPGSKSELSNGDSQSLLHDTLSLDATFGQTMLEALRLNDTVSDGQPEKSEQEKDVDHTTFQEESGGKSASIALAPNLKDSEHENEDDTTESKADTDLNDSELEDTSGITPPHPRSSTPEQKEKGERPQLAIPTLTFPEEAAENPNLDQLPSPHAFGPPMPLDSLVPTISQKISISTTVTQPVMSSPTSSLPSPSLPSPSLPSPETAKPPLSPGSSLLPFPGETSETKQEQDLSKTDETDMDFAASLIPPKLVETRRHSSVELKPDSEEGLLMPTQFPEMKRYTLVDVSPLSELGADNGSTLSDQNKDAFTPLTWKRERKLSSVDGTQSSSSSRSASLAPPAEPRNRRYSTFAEMGIQSYAMAKGERTVNASDVQVKRERRKSRLNFSLSSVNLTTPVAKPEEKADEMGKTTESSTASPEQKNESDKKESAKKKSSGLSVETKAVKKKPSKQRDCIIM